MNENEYKKLFIKPCNIDLSYREQISKESGFNFLYSDYIKKFIEVHSPYKIGDVVNRSMFYIFKDVLIEIKPFKITNVRLNKIKI